MLICLNDLFACLGLAQTRKLLTNFSKNSFYLLPEPLRLGEFLTNYCIKLDLEYSSRQHPTATLIYQNKEYITYINSVDSLQIGLNNTTFFYDELFDRVFCRNSGIAKGQYVALVFFILSFLLWLEPNSNINNKKKRHNRWDSPYRTPIYMVCSFGK